MNYPLYILIALQALDMISTVIALRNPNLVESNVMMNPLFKIFGVLPVMLVLKAGFAAFLFWQQAGIIQVVLYTLCVGYAYVVYNNFKLIRESSK